MHAPGNKLRRRLGWLCAGLLLGVSGIFLLRGPLTHAAITAGLQRIGAGDIKLDVSRSTPWLVELENLAFKIKAQSFAASRLTMERAHWWQPTLGSVRIEGVKVPVTIDGSDANPFAWASYAGEQPSVGGGVMVPLEKLSIDGQLILKVTGHEQPLTLKFTAQPEGHDSWTGALHATGSGLVLKAEASYNLETKHAAFHTTALEVELKPWQDIVQQLVVLPLGPWTMEGRLTGSIKGSYAKSQLAMDGRIRFEQGQLMNADDSIGVSGIESDFEFTDLIHLQSNPGMLRVRELRTGRLVANDLESELTFLSAEEIAVNQLTLKILGGTMAAEPFRQVLGKQELEVVVSADNLDVEKILALTEAVPAKASGRVDGRFPVRLDEHGLRIGTGWLELKKGVYAEVQLQADGLLTGGMSPKKAGFGLMKQIETGLMQLKLGALRMDIRPPDAPRGQTARLHLEGDPVDRSLKAPPVVLDVNVNGPLEQLLNFGFKNKISFEVAK